jgi:two-component system alkaline phosphatase synthesis response regulator PhoP
MTELQARRMSEGARFGEISLNFRKMELRRADQPVVLTLQEFKVLRFFVSRPEVVVSRQKLITAVWPKRNRSSRRTVDNHIARLRQKIEKDPAHPVYLLTVHGVGYKFVPEVDPRPVWRGAGGAASKGSSKRAGDG